MARKGQNRWASSVKNDVGEQNFTNQQLHKAAMHPNRAKLIPALLKGLVEDQYLTQVLKDGMPQIATVLKIFSGPKAPNRATTNSNETTTVDPHGWADSMTVSKPEDKKERVRLIARIPEYDTGLNWPMDEEDFIRLCAHGEYHAYNT